MTTVAVGARKTDDDSLSGRIVAGKYELEEQIGAGAMGSIYRARHLTLDKVVAVKIMHRPSATDANLAQRFQREARAASRLDHPCSLQILDYGREIDGTLYIAMEYLDGKDLFELLREAPLTPARIVEILTQTLSALAAAHDVGVLHRDLKPENIMIVTTRTDEGALRERVKVCDFGVAQIADPSAKEQCRLTGKGFIIGTPDYMSPEQARGETLDARSDLYSVGVILFVLLTGRLPFEADTPMGVALKQVNDEPPRPSDLNPAADPVLEVICLRALRKAKSERYASAREMRSVLLDALAVRCEAPSFISRPPEPPSHATTGEASLVSYELPSSASLDPESESRMLKPKRRARSLAIALACLALIGTAVVRRHQLFAPTLNVAAAAAPVAHPSATNVETPPLASAQPRPEAGARKVVAGPRAVPSRSSTPPSRLPATAQKRPTKAGPAKMGADGLATSPHWDEAELAPAIEIDEPTAAKDDE